MHHRHWPYLPASQYHHYNMSSPVEFYATIYNIQVTDSEVTLVKQPVDPLPRTPTPDEHPTNRPPLTLAIDSDPEEGKIISCIHHHGYPLSSQSSLNVIQGHLKLDVGTLCTIAISPIEPLPMWLIDAISRKLHLRKSHFHI